MSAPAQTPISNRGLNGSFSTIAPYDRPLALPSGIASIDNIRLKFVYSQTAYDFDSKKRYDTLEYLMQRLTSESLFLSAHLDISTSQSSFRIGHYWQTVTYNVDSETSFTVLVGRYCCDSSVKMLAPEAILDMNPNKIPTEKWKRIYSILCCGIVQPVSVQRFDLALDFRVPRDSLALQRRDGSKWSSVISSDGKAVTEYTGERSSHGAVKLYNKAEELGYPGDLTRLEFTLAPDRFKGLLAVFPTIRYTRPVQLDFNFLSLSFPVQAVLLHPDLLPVYQKSVERHAFAKFKKELATVPVASSPFFMLPEAECSAVDSFVKDRLAEFCDPRIVNSPDYGK